MRRFPLLLPFVREDRERLIAIGCPVDVPWEFAERGRAQAQRNHGQTLERLAERNGLSPMELMWAIEGRGLRWPLNDSDAEAVPRLIAALAAPPPPTDGKEQP
jgi:hypothetical protein